MKRKLKIVLAFSILGALLVYITFFSKDSFLYLMTLQNTEQRLKDDIQVLTVQNNLLLEEIHSIKQDTFFLEKIAREELGLVREGEVEIIFQKEY